MDNTRVFNQDCLPAMKGFRDKEFDLAIVDPLYGLDSANLIPGSDVSSNGIARKQKAQGIKNLSGDLRPTDAYFTELLRVSKNQIVWGINYYEIFLGSGRIVWVKNNPVLSGAELAYQSFTGGTYVFEYNWSGYIQGPNGSKSREIRIHPMQKPVPLYKWLLKNYAKPGDKILDTHLGSQSSRIAAFDMGFDFTGYELDKDYFDAGCKRFDNHKMQLKLFPV